MTPRDLTTDPTEAAEPFQERFERCLQLLRGALTELFAAVGADPERPQDVSRALGINKNLAWKVSKIIGSTRGAAALPHLPGPSGLEILLRAFSKAGAPASAQGAVRDAVAEFERMTELHAGDRATLELMVGSMLPDRAHQERLEAHRKGVFQGNGAIWGVQARLRLGTQIVAPSTVEDDRMDVAVISGLLGLRRLRPIAGWPLVQSQSDIGGEPVPGETAIDPSRAPGPPLMSDFCSSPMPPLRAVPVENGTIYELCDGPLGNTGAVDAVFGWIRRPFATIRGVADDDFGHHYLMSNTPVERVQLDLLVHRDLPFELPPKARLFSLMQGPGADPRGFDDRPRLPLDEQAQELGDGPPVIATPHYPRYSEAVQVACRALGYPLDQFRGWRLMLAYPPIPTLPTLSYRKPR